MKFTSTRNSDICVTFDRAVRDCVPPDGGVYVPSQIQDVRRFIYYIDENTSFASIAGSLTSALIKDEFSPIICETIATNAFPASPVVRQLSENLFVMELYHGFTGYHRDFGVSYLCSYLEATLQLNGGQAVFLDFTHGSLGALLARLLRGKKHIKAVLVYQKGSVRGIDESDFVWNGGNIYPVEMEGTEEQICSAISSVFADREFVARRGLTVANTTSVCRLLSQIFFFPYSFAQIKSRVGGDINYAMDAGNYGTLMAGLYSWRFALPVSGFYVPSTARLGRNAVGNPVVLDSFVSMEQRGSATPVMPANLERLEAFFGKNELMMRNFVYPVDISESMCEEAAKELFIKYRLFADKSTAAAYATIMKRIALMRDEDVSFVLMAYNHPSLSSGYCRHITGEEPEMPENIASTLQAVDLHRPAISSAAELRELVAGV